MVQLIEDRRVIPVVGRDLLTVPTPKGQKPLYPYLAERLADHLGVPADKLPEGGELNEVACRYLDKTNGQKVHRIYTGLRELAAETDALAVPDPLLQLAAIRPFQLFVTTTFDSFLTRALNQVRFGGRQETKVLSYSPDKKEDLPDDLNDATVVYHLLGKLSATPNYAVTELDLVEFFHSLQSETRRPHLLFDELNRQSLLILGSSLGGWLARFFMRMAKGQLMAAGQTADYVADAQVSGDSSLVLFLRRFSRGVEIFTEGSPADFVGQLHERWSKRHPVGEAQLPAAPSLGDHPAPAEPGGVFLSYASEDRPAVEKIKNALEAAGIDVFFDREDLQAGDLWEAKLQRTIRECSLFVPVISRNTLTIGRRFFRVEWNLAVEEAQMAPVGESFLLPVVIDDTTPSKAGIPPKFKEVQWQSLPAGETTREFVDRVQQLVRRYQKFMAAGGR